MKAFEVWCLKIECLISTPGARFPWGVRWASSAYSRLWGLSCPASPIGVEHPPFQLLCINQRSLREPFLLQFLNSYSLKMWRSIYYTSDSPYFFFSKLRYQIHLKVDFKIKIKRTKSYAIWSSTYLSSNISYPLTELSVFNYTTSLFLNTSPALTRNSAV